MIRFGLLSWSWPPEPSGLAVAAREIALSVAGTGAASVRVFVLDRPTGTATVEDGVRLIGCAPGRLGARLRRWALLGHLVAPFAAWRAIRREHRHEPFEVVEATNWYAPGLFVALLGPMPFATRHSTAAGTGMPRPADRRGRLDLRFARFLERVSARRSAAHVSNTAPHAIHVAALYGLPAPPDRRHAVLGLSLSPDLLAQAAAAPPPGIAAPLNLLFVGRNTRRKGADALLDALAALAEAAERGAVPDFRFHAVGLAPADVAPYPPVLRARTLPYPAVSEADKHALFADAHAVLAPSRYESFGLVYQEALAFGRPLLACAEDPSARALLGGENGPALLAERCDRAALLPPLRRLLHEPDLRAVLRDRALRAANRFDRATLGRGTLDAYAGITAVRSRAGSPAARAASGSGPGSNGRDSAAAS